MKEKLEQLFIGKDIDHVISESNGNYLVAFSDFSFIGQVGRTEVAEIKYNIFVPIESLVELVGFYVCKLEEMK